MKRILPAFKLLSAGSMAGNLTSTPLDIKNLDDIGIQLNFAGSPTGTFQVQVSADYQASDAGNVTNAGNWINLTLSPAPVASGSAGNVYIDIATISSPWLRVAYTQSGGTGSLDVWATGKAI